MIKSPLNTGQFGMDATCLPGFISNSQKSVYEDVFGVIGSTEPSWLLFSLTQVGDHYATSASDPLCYNSPDANVKH